MKYFLFEFNKFTSVKLFTNAILTFMSNVDSYGKLLTEEELNEYLRFYAVYDPFVQKAHPDAFGMARKDNTPEDILTALHVTFSDMTRLGHLGKFNEVTKEEFFDLFEPQFGKGEVVQCRFEPFTGLDFLVQIVYDKEYFTVFNEQTGSLFEVPMNAFVRKK